LDQATRELNAHLQTDVNLRNADWENQRKQLQAQLDQATAFRNAAADEKMRADQALLTTDVNKFNTGQVNETNQFNTNIEQQRNNLDAQLKQQLGISLAELEAKNNEFNASQAQGNQQFYSGLLNQRDLAQLAATLQAMGYTTQQIGMFMNAYGGAAGTVGGADSAQRMADDKFFWDMANTVASFYGPYAKGAVGAASKNSTSAPVGPQPTTTTTAGHESSHF